MPFNLLGRKHGVGINLMNDRLGFSNDFIFSASYAFRMDVGNGNLGIGVNVGMANPSIEPEWNGADVIAPDSDPAIPAGGSGIGLDRGWESITIPITCTWAYPLPTCSAA